MNTATTPKGGAAAESSEVGTLAGTNIVFFPPPRRNPLRAPERATLARFANASSAEWRDLWQRYLRQRHDRERRQRMGGAS